MILNLTSSNYFVYVFFFLRRFRVCCSYPNSECKYIFAYYLPNENKKKKTIFFLPKIFVQICNYTQFNKDVEVMGTERRWLVTETRASKIEFFSVARSRIRRQHHIMKLRSISFYWNERCFWYVCARWMLYIGLCCPLFHFPNAFFALYKFWTCEWFHLVTYSRTHLFALTSI